MGGGAHVFVHQQPPSVLEAFDAVPVEILGSSWLTPCDLYVVFEALDPDVAGWSGNPATTPEGDQETAESCAGQEPAEGCEPTEIDGSGEGGKGGENRYGSLDRQAAAAAIFVAGAERRHHCALFVFDGGRNGGGGRTRT